MRLGAACRDHQFVYYDERIEEKPDITPDLVVINVPLYLSSYIKDTSRKKWGRKPFVIWHGFYPTLFPKDCSKHADSVVIGDVVNIWSRIFRDLDNDALQSIYRSNQQHLFSVDRRIEEQNGLTPVLSQLRTSLGCACNEMNKDFCHEHILYPEVVHDDIEHVIRDVASIRRKIIQIRDDDFLIDQEYALTLLDRCWRYKKMWIVQSGKHLFANTHILNALKEYGVRIIYMKEDWMSDEVHDHIDNKDFWQQKRREISMLHHKRIACGCLLRLGQEGETYRFYDKLIRHLIRSKIDFIKVKVRMPIPDTPTYKKYKKQCKITADISQYDQWKPVLHYKTFSSEDLYSWMERFRDRFYSWDSILLRNLFVSTHLGIYNSFFFYLIPNLSFRNNFLEKAGYPP
jgi:hypothetical protein